MKASLAAVVEYVRPLVGSHNSEPQNTQTTQNNAENIALGATDRTAANYFLCVVCVILWLAAYSAACCVFCDSLFPPVSA
jgi:hypothetical protein